MVYIGIDLGTTYSCVAVVENGQPTAIYSDCGGNIVPSVVSYDGKEILVGNPALDCNTDMANILYDSKRFIGWNFLNDLPIAEDRSLWTFNATTKNNCAGYLLYKGTLNEKFIKPEEVSAEILKHMKYLAEKYLGEKISGAIVTVPASFSSDQIAATKKAIEIAGLELKSLLHEPTAAAIAYNQKAKWGNSRLLCFDFGGGTLDVSIVEMKNEELKIIAVTGDSHLGGQDFDSRIMKYVIKEFQKSSNYDIYDKPKLIKRLRAECRKGKEALSSIEKPINIHLEINNDVEINVELTRSKLIELCQDLFDKALSYVDRALKMPKISPEQIDYVILVGGSSRIPFIQQKLSEKFGRSKLKLNINPDEAVALGAAIYASSTRFIMTEQPPLKRRRDDEHSTNPVDPNPLLPDFIAGLNAQQQTLIESVWNYGILTLSKRIARIDALENKMEKETRRKYRRWRFEHDKSSVNAFIEKQNPTIQNHIRLCLSTQSNLDEFYDSMLTLLPSFDDKEAFLNWEKSEMLQRNRILFYMIYDEYPNYEGRICLFNSNTFEVEIVGKFSTYVNPCGVATGNDKIFLINGYKKVFEIFSYETKQLTRGPDPPEWRSGATVAYYKNKLYYIDGEDSNDQDSTSVNILINGTWKQGPNLPTKVQYASHAICNNKLYIISHNAVFQLSANERKWIKVGKMAERKLLAIASLNGKIYITGGYEGTALTSCLCFDPSQPSERRFTSIANMHFNRCLHSLVVANEKLYAIGGYQDARGKEFCKSVEEYDPTTNQWRISNTPLLNIKSLSINDAKSSDIPGHNDNETIVITPNYRQGTKVLFYLRYDKYSSIEGRICLFNSSTFEVELVGKFSTWTYSYGVATGNDQIFLMGLNEDVFEIFNYETKQFTKGSDLPEWRRYATVAYFKNKLYYIGGKVCKYRLSSCVNILINGEWQRGPDFPIKVEFARHVICNDKLYIISYDAVFQLSEDEREWIEVGKMGEERWGPEVASLNGKIYITGGFNDNDACFCFDPSQPFDRRFTPITNMHLNRHYHSLVVANGKMYAIGGRYKEKGPSKRSKFCKSIEEYDPVTDTWRIVKEID